MVHNSYTKYPCKIGQEGGLSCRVSTWSALASCLSLSRWEAHVCKMIPWKQEPWKGSSRYGINDFPYSLLAGQSGQDYTFLLPSHFAQVNLFSLFKKPNKSKRTHVPTWIFMWTPPLLQRFHLSPDCAHGWDICITCFLTQKVCLLCLVHLQSHSFSWLFDLWSQCVLVCFSFMIWTLSAPINRWGPVRLPVRANIPLSVSWAVGLQEQQISAGLSIRRIINPV